MEELTRSIVVGGDDDEHGTARLPAGFRMARRT
jgi:hypothetical protein